MPSNGFTLTNEGAPSPALVEGKALCRGPGWSGRANETTGQIQ